MMVSSGAYIPGYPPPSNVPLARYLPPIPAGVASSWLHSSIPDSRFEFERPWVLDPFCTSPRLIIEIAQAGYRVLVAANNPITRFLLELTAAPPTDTELRAALAELAATKKGDERLELHIKSLYTTSCDDCQKDVSVDSFIWDRELKIPFARMYHCPNCGKSGEYPTTREDISLASQFSGSGLHYARALERVAALDDPDRRNVEEALETYLPRALYALFTILNRIDGMILTQVQRNHLQALCLSAFDKSNTLWQYPTVRARPRQLTIPPKFRENNIWLALEKAIDEWATQSLEIPIASWPLYPPAQGGISIYEGRLKDLANQLSEVPISAVVTALPRPNQAFWTLSALWAGWLWGRDSVTPFKGVLRRRRYDWSWHTLALSSAFATLNQQLRIDVPMLGLIGEIEPGFVSASLVAAEASGFELISMAMRNQSGQGQFTWKRSVLSSQSTKASFEEIADLVKESVSDYLEQGGQPANYLSLHASSIRTFIENHFLEVPIPASVDPLSQINHVLEEALTYRRGFIRFGGSEKSLEVGQWWLRDSSRAEQALNDRVEIDIVNQLLARPGITLFELDQHLCEVYPGLYTPDIELIQVCLQSYAEKILNQDIGWYLRQQDSPRSRREELIAIRMMLSKIAEGLNYTPDGEKPLIWYGEHGEIKLVFYIIASAGIGELVFTENYPPTNSMIVLPGGRANLVAYKLDRDPRLRQAVESGWRFIKFRQVRMLTETPALTQESLEELLSKDALTYDAPQLRLF